ncbi:ABC transporter ATP-binding protein [Polyangium sp. y55x31]|uniref:ABC transporter ATP-binding protein n=1 Tax=Polyangium sp. y55x31 TaxID=3042688 RepID=UPI0024830D7F|nr:ABC transporter ATP-binding protein [Polyangium sp. y55x31]MDI1480194.1 ABC transporter ATP-binding protein [Polyangium sp. y55x31]
MPAPPASPLRSSLFRTVTLAWRASPFALAAMVFAALLAGAAPTGMAFYARRVLDGVARSERQVVLVGIFAEAALLFLTYVAGGLNQLATTRMRLTLGFLLQRAILEKAIEVPYACFEDAGFYDALTRARREAVGRPAAVLTGFFAMVQAFVVLAGSAALLFRFSPFCALAILVAALPSFFTETGFATAIFRLQNRRATEAREQAYLEQILTRDDHAKEVRLFGTGHTFLERARRVFSLVFEEDQALARRRLLVGLGADLVALTLFYAIYVFVAFRALAGALTVGDLGLALVTFKQGDGALKQALGSLRGLYMDQQYLGNLYGFLDREVPAKKPILPAHDTREEQGLRFENVGFTYPGAKRPALAGVDFYLAPGKKLALVGENGSGKSTILKLVAGLYEPTEGRILLDGRDLSAWDREALRARLAVVFQDFVRYQLPVRENVAPRAAEDAVPDEAITRALARSEAAPVVEKLARGLDQRLGKWFPGGVELSGGEWQKLALARAFLREKADLLLFDEPTAAIDPAAEAALFARVRSETEGRMAILVSHRFSTVRLADEILVMAGGCVAERGGHDALLGAEGRYAALFRLQAAGYR